MLTNIFHSSGLLDLECLTSSQVIARWSNDAPLGDAPVVADAPMAVSEQTDGAMAAIAFGQKLARNVNDYGAQTQRMILEEVSSVKEQLMEACEAASIRGWSVCNRSFAVSQSLAQRRDFDHDMMKDKLEEHLADLDFSSLEVRHFDVIFFDLSARWDANALAHDDGAQVLGGTCTSCPICYQHRPAVAVVPCGHVVCRDCHRSQQLRQCPMCREVTTTDTRGLFIYH